jgi:hypothetical protein
MQFRIIPAKDPRFFDQSQAEAPEQREQNSIVPKNNIAKNVFVKPKI